MTSHACSTQPWSVVQCLTCTGWMSQNALLVWNIASRVCEYISVYCMPGHISVCSKVTRSLMNIYATLMQWCISTSKDYLLQHYLLFIHTHTHTHKHRLWGCALPFLWDRAGLLEPHIQGHVCVGRCRTSRHEGKQRHRLPKYTVYCWLHSGFVAAAVWWYFSISVPPFTVGHRFVRCADCSTNKSFD